ncbi:MAG: nucleotidyltransferase domain-containing protein [Methanoregula sp.]|jgi:hypothetical protein
MSGQEGKEQIIARIRDVFASLPSIRVGYIYGSFLSRNDFRDIDIALLVDEHTSGDDPLTYASRVADVLGAALGFSHECDARVINHEPVWFQYEVIRSGRAVYVRDENGRLDFETRVLIEYQDLKFMYDLFDREYLAQV